MRVLIWHWGRFGAGPRYAALLAQHLGQKPNVTALLSLAHGAEILSGSDIPPVALPMRTYSGRIGFLVRLLTAPLRVGALARAIHALRPDVALCAMPSMLDLLMAAALRRAGVPFAVVVHDAAPHPGERVPLQHRLQRALLRRAGLVIALSAFVADRLGMAGRQPGLTMRLPPLSYGSVLPGRRADTIPRLLCFGRLLAYKGLDLLADALTLLDGQTQFDLRIVGQGPESSTLVRLRGIPMVTVENRWVPEDEVGGLLGWADILVLPYREASQSGVAAAALAAGRRIIATTVGGLPEQLGGEALATLCPPVPQALADAIRTLLAQTHAGVVETEKLPIQDAGWTETADALDAALRQLKQAACRSV